VQGHTSVPVRLLSRRLREKIGCVALLTDFLAGAVERLVGQTFVFGHYRGLLCHAPNQTKTR